MKKISIVLILLLLASTLYPQEKTTTTKPVKPKTDQKEEPSNVPTAVSPGDEKSSVPAKNSPQTKVKTVRTKRAPAPGTENPAGNDADVSQKKLLSPANDDFSPWSASFSFSLYRPNIEVLNTFFTAEELRLQLPRPSLFQSRYGILGSLLYSVSPLHEIGCWLYFSGAAQMRSHNDNTLRRYILLLAGPSYQFNWINPFDVGVDLQLRAASGYSYASFSRSYEERGSIVFRQSNIFAAVSVDAHFSLYNEFGMTLGAGYLFLPKRTIGSSDQSFSLSSPILTAGFTQGF